MILIQYIYVFLYVCSKSMFTYSKVIGSLNIDSIKCSPNDLLCFENETAEYPPAVEILGGFIYMLWSPYNNDENKTNSRRTNVANGEMQNQGDPTDGGYSRKSKDMVSTKSQTKKVKRSLELVEEHPPEGTYRPQSVEDEDRTMPSMPVMPSMPAMPSMPSMPAMPSMPSMPAMPSMPSMPAMPSMPTMPKMHFMPSMPDIPSMSTLPAIPVTTSSSKSHTTRSVESKITNTEATTDDITTTTSDVELLETTTEDYGDLGEPKCDYDPFQFIFKCGLSLITSIFGLSDTCCKPIF